MAKSACAGPLVSIAGVFLLTTLAPGLHRGKCNTDDRIHGVAWLSSIGKSVTKGCIRLINEYMMHRHDRPPSREKVIVL